MTFLLYPPSWRPNDPVWKPNNESAAVTVNTAQDPLARTTGWAVVARTTQTGGSIAIDFAWPQRTQQVVVADQGGRRAYGAFVEAPDVITITTWLRTRQGNCDVGLTFWDLTKGLADQVPMTVTDTWQQITLSASNPGTFGDAHRVEIYITTVNVDLLVDRLAIS